MEFIINQNKQMYRCKLLYKHNACSENKKFEFITIKIYVPIYFNLKKNRYTTTKKKEFLKNKLYY